MRALANRISSKANGLKPPVVRLAFDPKSGGGKYASQAFGGNAPTILLSHLPGTPADNVLLGRRGCEQLKRDELPALLISFFYFRAFQKERTKYVFRDWALDSGAFSAHHSGATIDLQQFIGTSLELRATDPKLAEIYALDVIGDWRASRRNTDKMWAAGVPAVPCFHHGEPWQVLLDLAKEFPKIALGGAVGLKGNYKIKWAAQCFARVWPKKIHGFGFGSEAQLMALPWHSVDATNWQAGPTRFGQWRSLGALRLRGSNHNLRSEVLWYLDLEKRARLKWRKQMAELERL